MRSGGCHGPSRLQRFCLTCTIYFYSPSDIDLLDSHLQAGRQAGGRVECSGGGVGE